MQQQFQINPKAPEPAAPQRSQRDRELRVQADAGVFGTLMGALQAGEAGIVRGEARNDSAAEWDAQRAREGRQNSRDGAQANRPGAQEPRTGLERLTAETGRPGGQAQQVTERSAGSETDGDRPSVRSDDGRAQKRDAAPLKDGQPANAEQRAQPAAMQAPAGGRGVVPQVAAGVNVATTANANAGQGSQSAQGQAMEGARGSQGGAARGRAPSAPAQRADQTFRFEKAFQSQLGRGLAQALRSADGGVTLRLRPANLGQLSVRVSVSENQVTATFEAQNAEARRMLDDSRGVLRQQLESRGLTVERIEIRLAEPSSESGTPLASEDDGGADRGQDGQGFAGDRDGRGASDGDAADGGSRRGATREDDERPDAGAEPWRALGTVRLNALA